MLEVQKEERRTMNGEIVKFKYTEVVADNYRYTGAVENKNDTRHDGGNKSQMFLKSAWRTTWWTIRVFNFFI